MGPADSEVSDDLDHSLVDVTGAAALCSLPGEPVAHVSGPPFVSLFTLHECLQPPGDRRVFGRGLISDPHSRRWRHTEPEHLGADVLGAARGPFGIEVEDGQVDACRAFLVRVHYECRRAQIVREGRTWRG